ncbi:hypothetical protein EYF80_044699 [Liparis tanakae]|uniref:Uncharacterized protein n=1 Tax=Liparis tanakae TaxID=230148 RepID=A0A4Z2FV26_9TELE|nr:hypothetical protein EYF80_044699 [Liparis tanakae]
MKRRLQGRKIREGGWTEIKVEEMGIKEEREPGVEGEQNQLNTLVTLLCAFTSHRTWLGLELGLGPCPCIQSLAWTWPPLQWSRLLLSASCLKGRPHCDLIGLASCLLPPASCLLPPAVALLMCPTPSSSLFLSVSWIVEIWIVVHAYY